MNGSGFSATDLGELQRQLGAWRRGQTGRARIPEEVWMAAAALARTQGVSWVARTLRLDYYKLRRRCPGADASVPAAGAVASFVELHLEDSGVGVGHARAFRVELGEARGARMTVELGQDVPALVALAEAFWRRCA